MHSLALARTLSCPTCPTRPTCPTCLTCPTRPSPLSHPSLPKPPTCPTRLNSPTVSTVPPSQQFHRLNSSTVSTVPPSQQSHRLNSPTVSTVPLVPLVSLVSPVPPVPQSRVRLALSPVSTSYCSCLLARRISPFEGGRGDVSSQASHLSLHHIVRVCLPVASPPLKGVGGMFPPNPQKNLFSLTPDLQPLNHPSQKNFKKKC